MSVFSDKILPFFFVNKCVGCGTLLDYDKKDVLCPSCLEKWESEKNEKCEDCRQIQTKCRCGFEGCSADTVGHLASYSSFEESIAKKLIFDIKGSNDSLVFGFVAREMADNVKTYVPMRDLCVTNSPRNPNAIRERGYDQSKKLAKEVANILGVPYVDVLEQRSDRKSQKMLDKTKREERALKNVEFKEKKGGTVEGRNVLLVDDVGTTGSTVSACTLVLREHGAHSVHCLLVARVNLEKKNKEKTLDKSEDR